MYLFSGLRFAYMYSRHPSSAMPATATWALQKLRIRHSCRWRPPRDYFPTTLSFILFTITLPSFFLFKYKSVRGPAMARHEIIGGDTC